MNLQEFKDMLEETEVESCCCCPVFKGLDIIRSYVPYAGVSGASNGLIFSVKASTLLEAGLSDSDAITLGMYGWKVSKNSGSMMIHV